MFKIFFLSWVVLLSVTQLTAQVRKDTIREHIDYRQGLTLSTYKYGTKRLYAHYIGIQANQLLKPISDYKTQNNMLRNPYGFVYTINHIQTGYGIGLGFGYESTYSKSAKTVSPKAESADGKASFRISFYKRKIFRSQWMVSAGIDLLLSQQKNINKTYLNGFIQEANHITMGYGLGPRVTIQYLIQDKIRLGTEVCWYVEKFSTDNSEKFTGLPATHSTSGSSSSTFLLPVSLFISVRIL